MLILAVSGGFAPFLWWQRGNVIANIFRPEAEEGWGLQCPEGDFKGWMVVRSFSREGAG